MKYAILSYDEMTAVALGSASQKHVIVAGLVTIGSAIPPEPGVTALPAAGAAEVPDEPELALDPPLHIGDVMKTTKARNNKAFCPNLNIMYPPNI